MSRTIEISDEDCEWIEEHWAAASGPVVRFHDAVVAARPPAPRSITLNGEVLTEDEKGDWHGEHGVSIAYGNRVPAKAFVRIWELEHEADRG